MKQGCNPTRKQKALIKQKSLNPANWLVVKNLPNQLHIAHRDTGNEKVIRLGVNG